MPYGKPFGFVRSAGMEATELAWSIAHELGHGAFQLQHVWKEQGYTTDTRNLMGYSKTGELFRWQWQDIHHPVSHSNLLADEEDLGFVAQIAKCIGAAAVDVAFNYTFKWVELWYDGNEPVEFTDFGTIFSKINKAELFSSAAIACATSVIPWPTDKAKTVATLTAAMGAGAVAITTELYNQYDVITKANKNISFGDVLGRLDWEKALVKGGTQAIIAGVATGVTLYATSHPKFLNFAAKLRKIGYEPLKKRLAKAGISGEAFEAFCKKFGIKSSQNVSKKELENFITKPLSQKLETISSIWKTKYPVQEMLEGRSFFEKIMGQYRYTKSSGWLHTGDIAANFKGIDFYKGSIVDNQIFAETAVSMKTTITTNVDSWLASAPIKKNIEFLKEGLDPITGLVSNNKTMFVKNAEVHIYMPKANITPALKDQWMNKLRTVNPKIRFEIKALEDFVK